MKVNHKRQIVDFFKNPIDIGDVVLLVQYSVLIPGKILAINQKSLSLSCEHATKQINKWNSKTKSFDPGGTMRYVTHSIPWNERAGLDYVEKALTTHNSFKYIYLQSTEEQKHIINLTKLNLYHETP